MLRRSSFVLAVALSFVCLVANTAAEPTIAWQPVGATGNHAIDGNEVTVYDVPEDVTLEIQVSGWGSAPGNPSLRAYQGYVVSAGYDNGLGEPLNPKGWPGSPEDGAFIDIDRPDFVFYNNEPIAPTDIATLDYGWGATTLGTPAPDDGGIYYGGTLILEIPTGACGTYTIDFNPSSAKTFMQDHNGAVIPGLILTAGKITVPQGTCCYGLPVPECAYTTEWECMNNPGYPPPKVWMGGIMCPPEGPGCCDCADDWACADPYDPGPPEWNPNGGVCTDDWCEAACWCHNTPNYDPAFCCNPVTGELILIDDGNVCTIGMCLGDGTVIQDPWPWPIPCTNDDRCVINDYCDDAGNCVGDLPAELSISCAEAGDCPAEWFCNFDTGLCDCLTSPHDAPKNRYLSFYPDQGGTSVAFEVSMTSSAYFPDSTGPLGWVAEPDEESSAVIADEPYFTDTWPEVVHVGDCRIVPAATYEVRFTPDGITFGDPVELGTIREPSPKKWADVVGGFTGSWWNPPNRVVNMDDVMAAVQAFQQLSSAPHWTWIDVDDQGPNRVVNFTDIFQIVQGFKGEPYPFSDPAECP